MSHLISPVPHTPGMGPLHQPVPFQQEVLLDAIGGTAGCDLPKLVLAENAFLKEYPISHSLLFLSRFKPAAQQSTVILQYYKKTATGSIYPGSPLHGLSPEAANRPV